MDKDGRQIFIQSIDRYTSTKDDSIVITNDWSDHSLIKIFLYEPMRTKLRINKTMSEAEYLQFQNERNIAIINLSENIELALNMPYEEFLNLYDEDISITERRRISIEELKERSESTGVVTYGDLLRGFGFIDYEYYINNELITAVTLNSNVSNHIQGNTSYKVGSEGIHEKKSEDVNRDELEDREGVAYLKNSDSPYTGKCFEFHDNGQKQTEGNFKDGGIDGLFETWYEKGGKEGEANFKGGKMDGLLVAWHDNGQKETEENYKDGKLDGLSLGWYENGQKETEGNFKDGKIDGPAASWHENGQKKGELNHKEGKLHGDATGWYENGQKQFETIYKDGNPDGLETYWHENGQKKAERTYKDGTPISEKYWNSKGEEVDSVEEVDQ